jgi:hypothetical protein
MNIMNVEHYNEENNTNLELVNELEEAYKNKLFQNKIDDEKIKKGNNKVMEIFADTDDFSKIADYMPFYSKIPNESESNQIIDITNKKRQIKEDECCICFTNLKDTFTVTTTCNHNLCFDCITKLKKMSCPLCRMEFPKEICKKIESINKPYRRPAITNIQGIDSSFSWSGTPAAFNATINYNIFS